MIYSVQKFNLPDLHGLSAKQIEIHLGLYEGYVKHINVLREQVADLAKTDAEKFAYAITETRRRLAFEFCGMRMHEYYFEQWEGGATGPSTSSESSALVQALTKKYRSWDGFVNHFKEVGGGTRGIGWTILYFDPKGKTPHVAWVGDHELGQLAGLPVILAMDMWEHAYMVDYAPSEKKEYIEAFFKNLNWSVMEKRFENAS